MYHLNYFEPYESKTEGHEDQLTRAFLIVLRYSPSALFMFYDAAHRSCLSIAKEKKVEVRLPSISSLDLTSITFETQKSDLKGMLANQVLSVLVTDEQFKFEGQVQKSTRGARYDGIIGFSDSLLLLVENKPNSFNVWQEQLSPNLEAISSEVDLINVPAIIEWKEIIKNLNSLVLFESVSGAEKAIISDFLDFVDKHFAYLNPYDNLSLCKNDHNLILRRIGNILLDISQNEEDVRYHRSWTYCVETGLDEIRLVGIEIHHVDDDDYKLQLSLYYGDTQNQARSFYQSKISYDLIDTLLNEGWELRPDFHISFIQKHLVWFSTPPGHEKKYYEYWVNNAEQIRQYPKKDLNGYLAELESLDVIEIGNEQRRDIKEKVSRTDRKVINICPGLGLFFSYSSNTARELDSGNELADEFKTRIRQGLGILHKPIEFIK